MVKQDIFQALVTDTAFFLAGPLTHIFNTITSTATYEVEGGICYSNSEKNYTSEHERLT